MRIFWSLQILLQGTHKLYLRKKSPLKLQPHYGGFLSALFFSLRFHSDQTHNFECRLSGITKSRTTPYHPQGNDQCFERSNQTLFNMLGTLDDKNKLNLKVYVATLVHAYNCIMQ